MAVTHVVVINVTNKDLLIPELKQKIPGGHIDEKFVLPYEIAKRYKQFLYPVAKIDPDLQEKPVTMEQAVEERRRISLIKSEKHQDTQTLVTEPQDMVVPTLDSITQQVSQSPQTVVEQTTVKRRGRPPKPKVPGEEKPKRPSGRPKKIKKVGRPTKKPQDKDKPLKNVSINPKKNQRKQTHLENIREYRQNSVSQEEKSDAVVTPEVLTNTAQSGE